MLAIIAAVVALAVGGAAAWRWRGGFGSSAEQDLWSLEIGPSIEGVRDATLKRSAPAGSVQLRRMTLLEPAGAEIAVPNSGDSSDVFLSGIDLARVVIGTPASGGVAQRPASLDFKVRIPAWAVSAAAGGLRLKLSIDVKDQDHGRRAVQVIVTSPEITTG